MIVSTLAPLPVALAIALAPAPASAQDPHAHHRPQAAQDAQDHEGHADDGAGAPMPHEPEASTVTGAGEAADHSGMDHSGMDHSGMDHSGMDHSGMDHSGMDHSGMDHSGMDHSGMDHSGMDHSGMDHSGMDHSGMDHSGMDHSGMDHSGMDHAASPQQPRTPIPMIGDADRRAAFPDLHAHATHGDSVHSYWSLDRLEAWDADEEGTGMAWEALAWVGGDIHRLWLRSEGERSDAGTESADLEVLYGRSVSRWWDVVAGIRHDFGGEGPSQTFAAFGVQGLAPYKFEVSATGYVGESGQTAASLEAEYDTLISNRLILQWSAEAELYGKDDPARGIGSGLSSLEAGARLRYEISRHFAPYVGVSWERSYGGTADLKRAHGEDIEDTRLVAGVRIWF